MEVNILNIKKIVLPQPHEFGQACVSKKVEYVLLCDSKEKLILKYYKRYDKYEHEKNILLKLNNESFTPELKYYDDNNMVTATTYCGKILSKIIDFNFLLYEQQLINIMNIMNDKYSLFHNDIRAKNICIDDSGKIYIIDLDKTSNKCTEQICIWGRPIDTSHDYSFSIQPQTDKRLFAVILGSITFNSTINKWEKMKVFKN